jgi:hypothetical protein
MPKVWNLRDPKCPPWTIPCDRSSPYGNPYRFGKRYARTRKQAIAMFRDWVYAQPELLERIRTELRGEDLGCWCAPKKCHADILFRIANEPPGLFD